MKPLYVPKGKTMAEYIDKESAIAWFMPYAHTGERMDADVVISDLKGMKAADVAHVKHGRWDDSGRYRFPGGSIAVRCSECGCALTASEYKLNNWNYCPVCGAKMDGYITMPDTEVEDDGDQAN